MSIKTVVMATVTCDIPGCVGGLGGDRNVDLKEKPPGDPVSLPQGWTVIQWLKPGGECLESLHVCGSCYQQVYRMLVKD